MDPYEPPRGLAAVYHMGELQAQLTAEREKLKRAEQTNAFLIELISQQHPMPNKFNTEIESLRQRIQELKLELGLKNSQLEQAQKQVEHDHARKAYASLPGTLLGGTVYASPLQMESPSCFEKQHDGVKDLQSGGLNSQDQGTALADAIKDLNEKHPVSDIPEAEWMQPVEEKAGTKTDGARAKPQMKRYFDPAAAVKEKVVVGAGSMAVAKKGPVQPKTQPDESNGLDTS
ncbi:hypothetical protein MPH_08103 [Macrophomina phaseolina MS6]|uniref:Uncharacterized protein n=1 Tax=Macrophomina phaseolina (strain MS6) TaxID=1126212 RepID=K2SCQ4_MACPH|nr:hypothetical protein MPH_08103 [Macrophomina phaseolina MS6]